MCDGKTHNFTYQYCNTCNDCHQLPLHDGQSEYLLNVNVDPARENEEFYKNFENDPIKSLLRTAHATGSGLLPSLKILHDLHTNPILNEKKDSFDSQDSSDTNDLYTNPISKEQKVLIKDVVKEFRKLTSEVKKAKLEGVKGFIERRDPLRDIGNCASCGIKEFKKKDEDNYLKYTIESLHNSIFAYDYERDAEKIARLERAKKHTDTVSGLTMDHVFSFYETKKGVKYHFIRKFVNEEEGSVLLCTDCYSCHKTPKKTSKENFTYCDRPVLSVGRVDWGNLQNLGISTNLKPVQWLAIATGRPYLVTENLSMHMNGKWPVLTKQAIVFPQEIGTWTDVDEVLLPRDDVHEALSITFYGPSEVFEKKTNKKLLKCCTLTDKEYKECLRILFVLKSIEHPRYKNMLLDSTPEKHHYFTCTDPKDPKCLYYHLMKNKVEITDKSIIDVDAIVQDKARENVLNALNTPDQIVTEQEPKSDEEPETEYVYIGPQVLTQKISVDNDEEQKLQQIQELVYKAQNGCPKEDTNMEIDKDGGETEEKDTNNEDSDTPSDERDDTGKGKSIKRKRKPTKKKKKNGKNAESNSDDSETLSNNDDSEANSDEIDNDETTTSTGQNKSQKKGKKHKSSSSGTTGGTLKKDPRTLSLNTQSLPFNEFLDNDDLFTGTFPQHFPTGEWFENKSSLHLKERRLLLLNYNSMIGRCTQLVFLLFNQYQRHLNITLARVGLRNDTAAWKKWLELIAEDGIMAEIKTAADNPKKTTSRNLKRRLESIFSTIQGNAQYSTAKRRKAFGDLVAFTRHFGFATYFNSISSDPTGDIGTFRRTFIPENNETFPAKDDGFAEEMKTQQPTRKHTDIMTGNETEIKLGYYAHLQAAIENPAISGEAFILDKLAEHDCVLKSPLKYQSRKSNSQILTGVLGPGIANANVIEMSSEKWIHWHSLNWCLPSWVIDFIISLPFQELHEVLAEYLETCTQTFVNDQTHLQGLLRRYLSFPTYKGAHFGCEYTVNTKGEHSDMVIDGRGIHTCGTRCHKGKSGENGCSQRYDQAVTERTQTTGTYVYKEDENSEIGHWDKLEFPVPIQMFDINKKNLTILKLKRPYVSDYETIVKNWKVDIDDDTIFIINNTSVIRTFNLQERLTIKALAFIRKQNSTPDDPREPINIETFITEALTDAEDIQLYAALKKFQEATMAGKYVDQESLEIIIKNLPKDIREKHLNEALRKRNGKVTDYNAVISGLRGCNTAIYFLGDTLSAKITQFYVMDYITKDPGERQCTLTATAAAFKHNEKYESRADDAGTPERNGQYLLTRILNNFTGHGEYSSVFCTLALLGIPSETYSEIPSAINIQNLIDYAKDNMLSDDFNYKEEDNKEEDNDEIYSNIYTPLTATEFLPDEKYEEDNEHPGTIFPEERDKLVFIMFSICYAYRHKSLRHFSAYEFFINYEIKRIEKEPANDKKKKKITRQSRKRNLVLHFQETCIYYKTHVIKSRSQVLLPKVYPAPPLWVDPKNDATVLIAQARHKFATYVLIALKPWNIDTHLPEKFSYENYKKFIQECKVGTPEIGTFIGFNRYRWSENWKESPSANEKDKSKIMNFLSSARRIWKDKNIDPEQYFTSSLEKDNPNNRSGDRITSTDKDTALDLIRDSLAKPSNRKIEMAEAQNKIEVAFNNATLKALQDCGIAPKLDQIPLVPNDLKKGLTTGSILTTQTNKYISNKTELMKKKIELVLPENEEGIEYNDILNKPKNVDALPDREIVLNDFQKAHLEIHIKPAIIAKSIDIDCEGVKILIHGGPGAGKSTMIAGTIQFSNKHRLLTIPTAPMAQVANAINGNSLHGTFGVCIGFTKKAQEGKQAYSEKILQELQTKYPADQLANLLIDEISAVGCALFVLIESICRKLTKKNKPWGGLNIFLLGDFFQLGPPDGKNHTLIDAVVMYYIFKRHEKMAPKEIKAAQLMHEFLKLELPGNERSKHDPTHATLIANLRNETIGIKPLHKFFLPVIQKYILNNAAVQQLPSLLKAPVIGEGNRVRTEIVRCLGPSRAKELHSPLIIWKNEIINGAAYPPEVLKYIYEHDSRTWSFFIQGRNTFLQKNLHPKRKLSNGGSGICDSLTLSDNNDDEIKCAQIEKDRFNILRAAPGDTVEISPPFAVNVEINNGEDYSDLTLVPGRNVIGLEQNHTLQTFRVVVPGYGSIPVTVKCFPFELDLGTTSYKAQGRTFHHGCIANLNKTTTLPYLTYESILVMMSRPTKGTTEFKILPLNPGQTWDHLLTLHPNYNLQIYLKCFTSKDSKFDTSANKDNIKKAVDKVVQLLKEEEEEKKREKKNKLKKKRNPNYLFFESEQSQSDDNENKGQDPIELQSDDNEIVDQDPYESDKSDNKNEDPYESDNENQDLYESDNENQDPYESDNENQNPYASDSVNGQEQYQFQHSTTQSIPLTLLTFTERTIAKDLLSNIMAIPSSTNINNFTELIRNLPFQGGNVHEDVTLTTRESFSTLIGHRWIDNFVLNQFSYFTLLHSLYINPQHANNLYMCSSHNTNISHSNYLERMIEKSNNSWPNNLKGPFCLEQESTIFMTINKDNNHWLVCFIQISTHMIYFIDPYGNINTNWHSGAIKNITDWLNKEWEIRQLGPQPAWTIKRNTEEVELPKQQDSTSCGIFVAYIIYNYITYRRFPTKEQFSTKADITEMRQYMAHTLTDTVAKVTESDIAKTTIRNKLITTLLLH